MLKRIHNKHNQFENMALSILFALVINGIAYYGTRLYGPILNPNDFSGPIDYRIPLVPWTISIYLGAYIFWGINYILGCTQEPEKAFRFMSADFLAKTVCLFCFLLLPTTTARPNITNTTLWDGLISWLYYTDAPDNLFPSIHCLTSSFAFIAVRENPKIPRWYQFLSFIMAAAVCVSTLTTKQHILLDVFGGIVLAEVSYAITAATGFSVLYARVISSINRRIFQESFNQM